MDQEFCEIHTAWLQRIPAEVQTPITPTDPLTTIDIGIPSSILRDIEPTSVLHDVESSPNTPTDEQIITSSPTLSISTVSDLTPTESGDDIGEGGDERILTSHKTFYLEDGNVEIACGNTIFRVHAPVLSFSSCKLQSVLSPSTLLNAPMPEGCPRIVFKDSADDFAILLKMIYTPGYVPPLDVGFLN